MRWTSKNKLTPYYGSKRIVKRFAIFPIETRNSSEYRWLETVYIKQRYERTDLVAFEGWNNICFATKNEYNEYCKNKVK